MKIKNYTSETPASTSMAKVEKLLVSAGARNIMKDYDDNGACSAVTFSLETPAAKRGFRLEANVSAIEKILIASYARPTAKSFETVSAQAERTAWKLVSDWVEIQISMIQLEQAELMQVFLPYLYDGKQTLFIKLKESNFKLLGS